MLADQSFLSRSLSDKVFATRWPKLLCYVSLFVPFVNQVSNAFLISARISY